ncbi:fumarylacetoacetate hydrolase family protein [Lysinimonas soli]|uniref:Fumarylacetoacetate hydrolase family protein n=1 Tax=Lysinimonas soli TaxID=1074233 RepID=A0ABW0NKF1_9MICO
MRLVKYVKDGSERVGDLNPDGTVTPLPWASLDELYATGDVLKAVRGVVRTGEVPVQPDRILAPVTSTSKVIGTGGNYADHAAEAASRLQVREPVFMPFLTASVIGQDAAIRIPTEDTFTDYEVELSVVIGKVAHRLTEANAMDYVAGYTIVNDVSARDVMERELLQVMLSKSPDTFVPVGPAIVTVDEVPDPYSLEISTRLNGEIRQHSNTGNMMVRIPRILEMITTYITLNPGDIVTTGTPGGVGFFRDPQESMQPGDTIEAVVESIGVLSNPVEAGWT